MVIDYDEIFLAWAPIWQELTWLETLKFLSTIQYNPNSLLVLTETDSLMPELAQKLSLDQKLQNLLPRCLTLLKP